MKQMNLGAILRAPLPQLIAQENYFGDYDHLLFLKNVGHKLTVSRKGKHFEQIADKELVFFFDFPFNSQLAEELSSYEPHVKFVNQPSAVLKTSEKDFEFTHFNKYLPPTILIRNSSELELEDFIKKKEVLSNKYLEFFKSKNIEFVSGLKESRPNFWLNTIIFKEEKYKDLFINESNSKGVMTRPVWMLMNKLSMFKNAQSADLRNAEWLEKRVVNIPSGVVQNK